MYCLSSEETLRSFSLNPRPCLLPPMPIPPCKIFIFGPGSSGKTTLCNLIAEYFKGKVTICLSIVFNCRVFVELVTCTGVAVAKASPHCHGLFYLQSRHASDNPISQLPSPGSSPPGSVPPPSAPSFRPIYIHSWWFRYLQILFSQHPSLSASFPLLSRDLVSTLKCKEIILSLAVRQLKAGEFEI